MRQYPLCPAGHLPHKGGDRGGIAVHHRRAGIIEASKTESPQPFSPLVGEMPGD
ncbi:lytic murein transglycosylase [Ensifer sp. MPMI2T]|nr:lytic murein transglycosylase [Ensifer sp. MPMI2T]